MRRTLRAPARAADWLTFRAAVHRLVRQIPRGRVATYGQLAAMLGRPRSARAVGAALRTCGDDVPWHRVVNASGGISLRVPMGSMLTQRIRLEHEGVPLRRGSVPLDERRWRRRRE
jgi:methylated-DNA-protein-cysteine methyltransferase related protein